jgi:hypothetical protein
MLRVSPKILVLKETICKEWRNRDRAEDGVCYLLAALICIHNGHEIVL